VLIEEKTVQSTAYAFILFSLGFS